MDEARIRCNIIDYRKGFIAVAVGIHEKCVNIETWNTDPILDIGNIDIRDPNFRDGSVTGNTEFELDISSAKELVNALGLAIQYLEHSS